MAGKRGRDYPINSGNDRGKKSLVMTGKRGHKVRI